VFVDGGLTRDLSQEVNLDEAVRGPPANIQKTVEK